MTYQVRTILRRALPITFWLLAVAGCIVVPLTLFPLPANYWWGFLVAVLGLILIADLSHLDRHVSSARQGFDIGLLLGIASYWLPTVVFLTLPCWIFMMTRYSFRHRTLLGTLLGFVVVVIYALIGVACGWIENVWTEFFSPARLWGWIPVGAVFLAWLGSYLIREKLKDR